MGRFINKLCSNPSTASPKGNIFNFMQFFNVKTNPRNCFYFVLVSISCPKALYHLESDNLFCITLVVFDWLG